MIANQSFVFEAYYGFKPDFEISGLDPETPNMIKDSSWASGSMNLSASGDDVLILDGDSLIVMAYLGVAPQQFLIHRFPM